MTIAPTLPPRALLAVALVAAGVCAQAADTALTRGHFYRGPGVSLLEPCGSKSGYWVADAGAARDLFPQYDALTRRDYERAFVILRGSVRPLARSDGIPEEYAGVFEPEAVLAVRRPAAADCR